MKKSYHEKKSDTLEVRLPHSKKEAFKAACEEEGITVSHAVRTFIDAYLRQSREMKLKRIAKELSMTLVRNPLKITGGLAAATAALGTALVLALPSAADDSNVQPIKPPVPQYPIELAQQGISSKCKATFDVSKEGFVETGIEVECAHPGFVEATRTAIETLRFEPKMEDGQPVRRTGVVYPIEYLVTPDTENVSGPEPS
ncbi:MAG: energy transducer TonB [Henriciella sp.]|uniref:energy transducer TonB n=1 Tax=Henriciella sp. TaxID=1968823 RepID=UPI0026106158|nr:energy transducer TonB [Henriciella sp.]